MKFATRVRLEQLELLLRNREIPYEIQKQAAHLLSSLKDDIQRNYAEIIEPVSERDIVR